MIPSAENEAGWKHTKLIGTSINKVNMALLKILNHFRHLGFKITEDSTLYLLILKAY